MRIIPLSFGEFKGYRFTTCDLSHCMVDNTRSNGLPLAIFPTFCWRIQRLALYHMRIIPQYVRQYEYKGYRFTSCELSHFLFENSKAIALSFANYPTFVWRIQRLPHYHLRIIPLFVIEYKGYRFRTCELSHCMLENTKSTALPLATYPTLC